jgi:hypothetical protein
LSVDRDLGQAARSRASVDIRALLLIALDDTPPANLPDRVMARLAMLTTILEFGRLLGAAPLSFMNKSSEGNDDDDGGSSSG